VAASIASHGGEDRRAGPASKKKSRRGGTPPGIPPRRLTRRRAPRRSRVALHLVVRRHPIRSSSGPTGNPDRLRSASHYAAHYESRKEILSLFCGMVPGCPEGGRSGRRSPGAGGFGRRWQRGGPGGADGGRTESGAMRAPCTPDRRRRRGDDRRRRQSPPRRLPAESAELTRSATWSNLRENGRFDPALTEMACREVRTSRRFLRARGRFDTTRPGHGQTPRA
jgi:hypothetical protein